MWYPDNINEGNLENFYYLLVGVSLLDMLYLYAVSKNYVYHGWSKQFESYTYRRRRHSINGVNGIMPSSTHQISNTADSLPTVSGNEVSEEHVKQS